ncbi:MAG TPA: hypothetical protein VGT60_04290 [Candidatus Limnocylindria bacterium]|nr:hypothetical protein [Candidatus Limnocylindria bacterium]
MKLATVIAPALALAMLGTGPFGSVAFADTGSTTAPAPVATDHTFQRAIDAFRDVLDRMVDAHVLTPEQREAVVAAAVQAGWDGFSVERLGDILVPLVANGTISAAQRDAILDGVRRSDRVTFRLAVTLDRLGDRGLLSRDQRDAIVTALHRSDWDGFSIERLGDILTGLVKDGAITARERAMILDGVRR